jgi:hypothetical protein
MRNRARSRFRQDRVRPHFPEQPIAVSPAHQRKEHLVARCTPDVERGRRPLPIGPPPDSTRPTPQGDQSSSAPKPQRRGRRLRRNDHGTRHGPRRAARRLRDDVREITRSRWREVDLWVESGLTDDVLWLGAGNPVLVLAGAVHDETVVAEPKVTCPHPSTPVLVRFGASGDALKSHGIEDWLEAAIAAARLSREATFRTCSRCKNVLCLTHKSDANRRCDEFRGARPSN